MLFPKNHVFCLLHRSFAERSSSAPHVWVFFILSFINIKPFVLPILVPDVLLIWTFVTACHIEKRLINQLYLH